MLRKYTPPLYGLSSGPMMVAYTIGRVWLARRKIVKKTEQQLNEIISRVKKMDCSLTLPVEEVVADGPGRAVGRRIVAKILEFPIDALQSHLDCPFLAT